MKLRTAPPRLSQIQAPIRGRLDLVMDELRRIVAADFDAIEEVNEYLFQVRGKLFRPSLLLLCEEVVGRPSSNGNTLAAVVELIHLATLVHDDAVDHSVLRRGMPTVNALWSHQVSIIMGDYLYSRSLSEIARLGEIEPVRLLAEASNAMSVGEMRQLVSHDALGFGERDYFRLIECKTASLISAACELGALRADAQSRAALGRFGMQLGMAFQIVDDLLDYTSDESVTGKPAGLDLREHKVTLPLIASLPHLSRDGREQVEAFFRQPEPGDEEIAAIVRIVAAHGGLEYARERAQEFAARAALELDTLPEGPALESLRESISYVIERQR